MLLISTTAWAAPRRLQGDRILVLCPENLVALGRQVRDRLPERRREVEGALGGEMSEPITVRIVADDAAFSEIVGPRAPEIAAVAYPRTGTLVLKASAVRPGTGSPLAAIVRHELVHVVLGDLVPENRLPLWFEEGLAELVGGAFPLGAVEDLPAAVTSGRIRDLDDLATRFPEEPRAFALAYRQSESFMRFLEARVRARGIREIVRLVRKGRNLDDALFAVAGRDRLTLERLWREDLEERNPLWEVLLRTRWIGFLLFVSALLAIVASGRYLVRRRRILRELAEDDERQRGP